MSGQLNQLDIREELSSNKRLHRAYANLVKFIEAIRDKDLSIETIQFVNDEIDKINAIDELNSDFRRQLKNTRQKLIRKVSKAHNLVTKYYYRNLWMSIGIGAFGVPLGVALGSSVDNMGMIGTGLPIGMVIGMSIGIGLDNKALKEGRQIDVEI